MQAIASIAHAAEKLGAGARDAAGNLIAKARGHELAAVTVKIRKLAIHAGIPDDVARIYIAIAVSGTSQRFCTKSQSATPGIFNFNEETDVSLHADPAATICVELWGEPKTALHAAIFLGKACIPLASAKPGVKNYKIETKNVTAVTAPLGAEVPVRVSSFAAAVDVDIACVCKAPAACDSAVCATDAPCTTCSDGSVGAAPPALRTPPQ